MTLSLRQLEYAAAVAEHLHFRRAAEACHVSQPALSNQIAQLEQTLGVRLFERGAGGVLVTSDGQQVVAQARGVLAAAQSLEQLARHLREPFTGRLRLGTIPTVAPYLLPHVIPLLHRHHPRLDLVIHEEQTDSLLLRLRRAEADLLLLALPIEEAGLTSDALFDEAFVLVVPGGHALAERELAFADGLSEEPVLLLDDGHCFRDHALEVCQAAGASERRDVRAAHLGTLVELVRAKLGITLLPRCSLPTLTHHLEGLKILPFLEPVPTRRLGLVWRKGSGHEAEHRSIGDLLRAELSGLEGLTAVPRQT